MKVSVIIPCYNFGEYIEQSILSAVNQITNFEYEICSAMLILFLFTSIIFLKIKLRLTLKQFFVLIKRVIIQRRK